jgi:hypothetical protein
VGYLGLDPRVRQSGTTPARHGSISKQGSSEARHVLVEAAWTATRTPGPLQAFGERIRARRGPNVAAVAIARKLAALCWHPASSTGGLRARPPLAHQGEAPPPRAAGWSRATPGSAERGGPLCVSRATPLGVAGRHAGGGGVPSAREGLAGLGTSLRISGSSDLTFIRTERVPGRIGARSAENSLSEGSPVSGRCSSRSSDVGLAAVGQG